MEAWRTIFLIGHDDGFHLHAILQPHKEFAGAAVRGCLCLLHHRGAAHKLLVQQSTGGLGKVRDIVPGGLRMCDKVPAATKP